MVQLKWYLWTQWTWLLSTSNLKPCCFHYCPGCLDTCVHSEWEEVVVKQPVLKYGALIRMLWWHEWCILGRRIVCLGWRGFMRPYANINIQICPLYICTSCLSYFSNPYIIHLKIKLETESIRIQNETHTQLQFHTLFFVVAISTYYVFASWNTASTFKASRWHP